MQRLCLLMQLMCFTVFPIDLQTKGCMVVAESILGDPTRSEKIFNEDFLSAMVHHKIPANFPFSSSK